MIKYEKFTDEKCHNGDCLKVFCSSFTDWKEKEIKEEFPEASCVSMPGLGYTGENGKYKAWKYI